MNIKWNIKVKIYLEWENKWQELINLKADKYHWSHKVQKNKIMSYLLAT